jgi:hypothetical protein
MNTTQKFMTAGGATLALASAVTGSVLALGPASSSAAPATPRCDNDTVTATYQSKVSGHGKDKGWIVLENTSSSSCSVKGFGRVSYTQEQALVGAPAQKAGAAKPRVVLEPGDSVRSPLTEVSFAQYPAAECQPVEVRGWAVWVPGEDVPQQVALGNQACANPEVQQMTQKAYR